MSKIVRYIKLKEICTVNQGLQIPIEKRFKEKKENRYFYITVQFLKESYKEKYYIDNPPKSSICKKDDILVVRTGNTGQIITGIEGSFHNNFFKVNYDKNKVFGRFLYYCLITKEKQREMAIRAGITTIPDLNHFMFLDIKVPLVEDLKQQEKISNVLDVINAKIELNNKINAELETMAKTLYDYWFVQFDFPDENGKPYKSSGGEMIWSKELKRDIPKGWEVQELGEVCQIYQPQTISEKDCVEGGKYFVHGSNGIIGKYHEYNHEDSEIIVSCRGDCGNIHRTLPKMWVTGNAMVFKMLDKTIHNEFLYQALRHSGIKNISSGSVQGQITRTNVAPLKIIIPEKKIIDKFSEIAKNLVSKKLLINEENQKLADLRDFLLPMLMNGQIVVE